MMAKDPLYERVHVNQWLKTSTGVDVLKNFVPDVLGVRKTGKTDIVEVVSKTDEPKKLLARTKEAHNQLPLEMRGEGRVIAPTKGLTLTDGKQ